MMAPTVMKFGGTSVEDSAAFERVASIVGRSVVQRLHAAFFEGGEASG